LNGRGVEHARTSHEEPVPELVVAERRGSAAGGSGRCGAPEVDLATWGSGGVDPVRAGR